jgi:hypothetical protein
MNVGGCCGPEKFGSHELDAATILNLPQGRHVKVPIYKKEEEVGKLKVQFLFAPIGYG